MVDLKINLAKLKIKAVSANKPGGQRTNRKATKVQVWIKVDDLPLSESEKKIIRKKLAHHLNKRDELWFYSQEERFQHVNLEKAVAELKTMILKVLTKPRKRLPTEPSLLLKKERLIEKRIKSEKKKSRRFKVDF